jgi:hypothetical protein
MCERRSREHASGRATSLVRGPREADGRAEARKTSETSLPADEERSERSERAPQSVGEACGVVLSRFPGGMKG